MFDTGLIIILSLITMPFVPLFNRLQPQIVHLAVGSSWHKRPSSDNCLSGTIQGHENSHIATKTYKNMTVLVGQPNRSSSKTELEISRFCQSWIDIALGLEGLRYTHVY
jgi:hypothetical protein